MSRMLEGVLSTLSVELCCLLVLICNIGISDAILCVKCDSNDEKQGDRKCEMEPSNPVGCMGSTNISPYCSITKYLSENDSLLRIIRDCTTIDKQAGDCQLTGEDEPFKVCFTTCSEDGCNSAPALTRLSAFSLLSGLIVALVLQRRGRSW